MSATQEHEINQYLNETLEGVPDDIANVVLESLAYFGEPTTFTDHTGSERNREEEQIDKLRFAFTSLTTYLIENRLGELNEGQRVFLNTGAITDYVVFEDDEGAEYSIQLLDSNLYLRLRQAILNPGELPDWFNFVYRNEDKFNAIALGVLEPAGLDKRSLAKFRSARGGDASKSLSLDQTNALNNAHESLINQNQEQMKEINQLVNEYYTYVRQIPMLQDILKKIERYEQLIASRTITNDEKDELRQMTSENAHLLGTELAKYCGSVMLTLQQIKEKGPLLDTKHRELKETTAKLINAGIEDFGSVRDRDDILFDDETVRLIKTDFTYIASFAVSAARNSSLRITESASRILLDVHAERSEDPLGEAYCTLQNVYGSIQKMLTLHTNLFPLDQRGNPILPPILIEPLRNYVDLMEDRFEISFVSGDPQRKGPRFSFTPVDMVMMRCFGLYAFKDKIFDYRGDRISGNLMADYAGKLEAKTTVKWTGDDKKFKLVASSQEVDSANRNEAVEDYINFLFNAVNDFPPPTGLSKRKISVMLKYVIVENLLKTIALTLRYVADKEPDEAKITILHHAEGDKSRAKKLIEDAYAEYRTLFTEGLDVYLQKIIGNAPV